MNFQLLFLLIFVGYYPNSEKITDFDSEIIHIVNRFQENVVDENECVKILRDLNILQDELDKMLQFGDQSNNYTVNRITQFKHEVDAIEEFIACIGLRRNTTPSIDNFILANKRINADVTVIAKDQYCVDIEAVIIGDYISYIAVNKSVSNIKFDYKLIDQRGNLIAMGEAGVFKESVRCIHNNRNDIQQTLIRIKEISCNK